MQATARGVPGLDRPLDEQGLGEANHAWVGGVLPERDAALRPHAGGGR